MKIETKNQNPDSDLKVCERKGCTENVIFLDVELNFQEPTVPQSISITFEFPCVDTYSVFSPTIWSSRHLGPNWKKRTSSSRLSSGLPVHTLVSIGGMNRLTMALSDADIACELRTGVIEENANHDVEIKIFTKPTNPIKNYRATVRLDFSDVRYEDAVRAVEKWWSEECGYKNADVPDYAKLPMYSTWYSFHQNVAPNEIVEQCKLAKALGMESVIVDDGWQTEDGSRGYAFCGDWEVAQSKVADMKAFVDDVHSVGMKFLIWFSVPFVGVHSKAFKKFEGKYLGIESRRGELAFAVLDPRFPDVRRYLVELYEKSVLNWGIDGLKLDFVDSFQLYKDTPTYSEGWDTQSLDDGVNKLMTEITETLRAIKPDIMIEFRQSYVGPAIRKYGNMLRVCDCPLDALINRRASADLRMVSGDSAIHSDMIMWNVADTVESAAIQMISTLFCVPQISVLIDKIPQSHKNMLAFYLSFWRKNQDTLLNGEYRAYNPEAFYSLVTSKKDGHIIAVNYVETVLTINDEQKLSYVNGSGNNTLTVRFSQSWNTKKITIQNCQGDITYQSVEDISVGVKDFKVPRGGMLTIE